MCCHALFQGIFPNQGPNSCLIIFPALAGGFFTTSASWEAQKIVVVNPKMPPPAPPPLVIRASRYSCPCVIISYITSELVYVMNWPQKWWNATFEARLWKNTVASALLSHASVFMEDASCRGLRQPCEETDQAANWGFLPRAVCASHLGSGFSSPSQAFKWLLPWSTYNLQPHDRP